MTEQYRFVVVGAGGIGSHLCHHLCALLEYRAPGSALIIVDGDAYEPKNKQRQIFSRIGNKAEVLAGDLAPIFTNIFVVPMPRWVVETVANVVDDETSNKIACRDLVAEGDVIFAVVDNFKARKDLIDAAAELENVDVFLGGNDDRFFGSVYHYQRRDGQDVTEHPNVRHEEFIDPPDRNPGEMSCQERAAIEGGTQFLATNAAVAAYLLGRVQVAVIDGGDPTKNTEIFFDLEQGLAQGYDRAAQDEMITQGV